jgi:hypothetical protein
MKKEDFKAMLTARYAVDAKLSEIADIPSEYWPWDFLAGDVFDFTLYDSNADVTFSKAMVEVITTLLDQSTFEFINDSDQYNKYLTMVNMPFLNGKLDWGGSIRGACFDEDSSFDVCCGEVVVEKNEVKEFMYAVVEWSKENCVPIKAEEVL